MQWEVRWWEVSLRKSETSSLSRWGGNWNRTGRPGNGIRQTLYLVSRVLRYQCYFWYFIHPAVTWVGINDCAWVLLVRSPIISLHKKPLDLVVTLTQNWWNSKLLTSIYTPLGHGTFYLLIFLRFSVHLEHKGPVSLVGFEFIFVAWLLLFRTSRRTQ